MTMPSPAAQVVPNGVGDFAWRSVPRSPAGRPTKGLHLVDGPRRQPSAHGRRRRRRWPVPHADRATSRSRKITVWPANSSRKIVRNRSPALTAVGHCHDRQRREDDQPLLSSTDSGSQRHRARRPIVARPCTRDGGAEPRRDQSHIPSVPPTASGAPSAVEVEPARPHIPSHARGRAGRCRSTSMTSKASDIETFTVPCVQAHSPNPHASRSPDSRSRRARAPPPLHRLARRHVDIGLHPRPLPVAMADGVLRPHVGHRTRKSLA